MLFTSIFVSKKKSGVFRLLQPIKIFKNPELLIEINVRNNSLYGNANLFIKTSLIRANNSLVESSKTISIFMAPSVKLTSLFKALFFKEQHNSATKTILLFLLGDRLEGDWIVVVSVKSSVVSSVVTVSKLFVISLLKFPDDFEDNVVLTIEFDGVEMTTSVPCLIKSN